MKSGKLPSLITTLILTLITIIMWVSFDVYRALTVKPLPEVAEEVSRPLVPSLDIDVINQVESRIFLNDSEIPENIVSGPEASVPPLSSPTPEETPVPIESTPSAEPTI